MDDDEELERLLRGLELPDVEDDCEDGGLLPRLDQQEWDRWED